MNLITLKRFEFSASHQHSGAEREARLHGHNFVLWVGVRGAVNERTGMIINVVDLKRIVNAVLDARYDHRCFNTQFPALDPTLPNIARALWDDLTGCWPDGLALQSLELREEGGAAARVTANTIESVVVGEFSAAHRTHAPRLSVEENHALYGICNNPAGHGHNYGLEITLPETERIDPATWMAFDHRNLSVDVPELAGRNVVTEAIAELIAQRAPTAQRVRVWELPTFFAEYRGPAEYALGRRYQFNAAHRLHSPHLSTAENQALYGKCNRPETHGHTYQVEVIVTSPLDPRTETAYDLGALDSIAADILAPLDYVNLEASVPFFQMTPSTGENIARYLWQAFAAPLGSALEQVQVWETPNNSFVARRF